MSSEEKKKLEQAITGTFMWSFKKGDNILYNLEIIWELYKARSAASPSDKTKYIKPIILLQVSILECILDDFVKRVGQHVHDRVPNITQSQIQDFKTKKRDKLEHYISAAKKHNLFDKDGAFYEDMDKLRKARNRFHIQNSSGTAPRSEALLYNNPLLTQSEMVFEIVLERMINKFHRYENLSIQFADVPLPWPRVIPVDVIEDVYPWMCWWCSEVYPHFIDVCPNCSTPRP